MSKKQPNTNSSFTGFDRIRMQEPFSMVDLITLGLDLLRSWWVILMVGLTAGLFAAGLGNLMYQPSYSASATLVITTRTATRSAAMNASTASDVVGKFSTLLQSNLLMGKARQELGLSDVYVKLEAEVVPETNLMTLRAVGSDAYDTYRVLDWTIENYHEISDAILTGVVVEVLQSPVIPTWPVNASRSRRYFKLAFLLAAAAYAAFLGVFSYNRDTAKCDRDVRMRVDTRLLGTIYYERKKKLFSLKRENKKQSMRITNPLMSFRFVEANKMMALRVRQSMEHRNAQILMVTSVTENEGKSTVAANLALSLSQEQKRVLLVDGDFRKPAQYKIFDREKGSFADLHEVLAGNVTTENMVQQAPDSDLFCIFNGTRDMHLFESKRKARMVRLLLSLRDHFDYIIIDTAPMGLVADTEEIAQIADASLLVIRQDFVWCRDTNDIIDCLNRTEAKVIGCVLNCVPGWANNDSHGAGAGYGRYYGNNYHYKKAGKKAAEEEVK